ncbi:hypothetical protein F4604DRAFT_1935936 [Suillus subluteus]|nr:hypothetical protein F4604DRAFT_1935936 [Suillus subluteus]
MNPSCHFREWSANDARQLLKVKGTIQDVDGECSLKVTGQSRKGFLIAAHYRLPLYALNKKFGLYRKVVEHLQDSSSDGAAHLRNTYLSVMDYLNDIRIAFLEDSGGSENPLSSDFRSAALDYYLWLDHTADGFHDDCREALETTRGVTFEGLQNGQCPDILVFLDWNAYHKKKCREHDFCGALQGCGQGEDIKLLLNAVDGCIEAPEDQISTTAAVEAPDSAHSPTQMKLVSNNMDVSDPFPKFPLPFNIDCCTISLSTLGENAREIIVGGFGRWLSSHVAMRFREIQGLDDNEPLEDFVANGLLIRARSTDEFLELFGMAEMMNRCQELFVDRGAMARFFTTAGKALYISKEGRDCVVQYDEEYGADAAVLQDITPRVRQAVGVQCESSMVGVTVGVQCESSTVGVTVGVQCESSTVGATVGVQCESSTVGATVGVQCESSMVCATVGVQCESSIVVATVGIQCESIMEYSSSPRIHAMLDCGVQTDIHSQDDRDVDDSSDWVSVTLADVTRIYNPPSSMPMDMGWEDASLPHPDEGINEQYTDDTGYELTSGNLSDHTGDESHIASIHLEASSTSQSYVSHTPSLPDDPSLMCNTHSSSERHEHPGHDTVQKTCDLPASPPLKSRLRDHKQARPTNTPTVGKQTQGPSKPGRPVVYAAQRPALRGKASKVSQMSTAHHYTIQGLLDESQTGGNSVTQSIASFLMDPKGLDFLRSTIQSNHDSWLAIARHVALLLRDECMSHAMSRAASSLMAIELWVKDIAIECDEVLRDQTGDSVLPQLAHCVIVELSNSALVDEDSLRCTLHRIWTNDNIKSMKSVLRYLLRVSRPDDNDPYAPGLRILSSVMADRSIVLPAHKR